jgi:hypothetical protein
MGTLKIQIQDLKLWSQSSSRDQVLATLQRHQSIRQVYMAHVARRGVASQTRPKAHFGSEGAASRAKMIKIRINFKFCLL